jgi:hypothetical protein
MNERIKELAERLDTWYPDKGWFIFNDEQLEQFSELIMKECYSVIIKSQRGHFNPATSWDAVKQHFGVEE